MSPHNPSQRMGNRSPPHSPGPATARPTYYMFLSSAKLALLTSCDAPLSSVLCCFMAAGLARFSGPAPQYVSCLQKQSLVDKYAEYRELCTLLKLGVVQDIQQDGVLCGSRPNRRNMHLCFGSGGTPW